MRQKQESLQHRLPTYHRQQRRPLFLYLSLPHSHSLYLVPYSIYTSLPPSPTANVSKCWPQRQIDTQQKFLMTLARCLREGGGRKEAWWERKIEAGMPALGEGGCWYSGHDRTFGLYPELWSGFSANGRQRAVWQVENSEWRQRGTRNGSGTGKNRRKKVHLRHMP